MPGYDSFPFGNLKRVKSYVDESKANIGKKLVILTVSVYFDKSYLKLGNKTMKQFMLAMCEMTDDPKKRSKIYYSAQDPVLVYRMGS